jgi:hypothetical protein
LNGPQQFNMDGSLVKSFQIVERFRFELRMDVFNVINNITWNNPDTASLRQISGGLRTTTS